MKKTIFLVLFPLIIFAQNTDCGCSMGIDELYGQIIKMPSYKNQFKGIAKTEYEATYHKLKKRADKTANSFECYKILAELLYPLKDNHLGFWQKADEEINEKNIVDNAFIEKYIQSEAFKNFPTVNINLDSLTTALKDKPKEDVEGIYHYSNYVTTAVYRTHKKDSLVGVVISARLKNWQPGQLAFTMKEYAPGRFNAISAHLVKKNFSVLKQEAFANGILFAGNWKKNPDEVNFAYKVTKDKYSLESINPNIQYLRLGSFASNNENVAEAAAFCKNIKDSLTAKVLIVDIRGNGGGADKVSDPFLKMINKYARNKPVYVLVNHWTVSNAEQFTLRLKKNKNVVLLGETTNGTLAYGSNYGNTVDIACGNYLFYPTDMDSSEFSAYESVGVKPDVLLDYTTDWVEQVTNIVNAEVLKS